MLSERGWLIEAGQPYDDHSWEHTLTDSAFPADMLAHQGGWDEILLILGPVLVVVGLLRLAKKRVDATTPPPASTDAEPLDAQPDS